MFKSILIRVVKTVGFLKNKKYVFGEKMGKMGLKILLFSFITKYKISYATYFNVNDQVSLKFKYNFTLENHNKLKYGCFIESQ